MAKAAASFFRRKRFSFRFLDGSLSTLLREKMRSLLEARYFPAFPEEIKSDALRSMYPSQPLITLQLPLRVLESSMYAV
jgi:hypothetical protein